MAGLSKTDFTKQTAHINAFNVGSATLKKQAPQQHAQAKSFPSQSEPAQSKSQIPSLPSEAHHNTPTTESFKNNKQAMQYKDKAPKKQSQGYNKSSYTPPSFRQQKNFIKQFDNKNSRRPTYKSGGEVDPYSPDIAQ